jgi:hypothetical protein
VACVCHFHMLINNTQKKMHIVKPQSQQNQSDHNEKELPQIEVLRLL